MPVAMRSFSSSMGSRIDPVSRATSDPLATESTVLEPKSAYTSGAMAAV
jgi:hypothetical protein